MREQTVDDLDTPERLESFSADADAVGYRAQAKPRTIQMGPAMIVASFVVVIGAWAGKFFYDHIQEQKNRAAIMEAGRQLEHELQRSAREHARTVQVMEGQRHLRELQERQEQRRSSNSCKFWTDQHQMDRAERSRAKKQDACGF
ncbi:TPA: hypothetical protein ACQJWO_005743 [Klebsiella pneumoniae]